MQKSKNTILLKKISAIFFIVIVMSVFSLNLSGCRNYDRRFDAVYFFKTEPEKAVLDFIYSMRNHDAEYIYNNLMLDKDKNSISKEKFISEFSSILSDIDSIEIKRTVYLGYENEMSKVVVEFDVKYMGGKSSQYKKYVYLISESGKWKIVFDKTFI
ncbi:MAG: hypothetical protein M1308_00130 [Actinobacteria bacterium]|nr:hypothetical protein [Actinomycetota bacterium]